MYWFIAAVAVLVVEMFVGTLYLLIISAALAGAGAASLLFDGSAVPIWPAAAISAVGLFWLHGFIKRRRTPADEAGNDLDIGQTVKILRRVSEGQYEVSYRGTTWQARALNARTAAEPSFAVIGGKEGNILLVHLN
jgi:nodulation efficiency nfeD family protein